MNSLWLSLPAYILVKLKQTQASQLDGLGESVILIEAASTSYRIGVAVGNKTVHRVVHQRQYPLTAAYAFMDYQAQGQTILHVIIDIGTPPSGTLISLFNLYVALLCSSSHAMI